MAALVAAILEVRRDQGGHDDHRDDRQDVLVDGDRLPDEVAEQADTDRPKHRADEVCDREPPLRHATRARHHRDDGAHDPYEPRDPHLTRAAPVEELLRPYHAL